MRNLLTTKTQKLLARGLVATFFRDLNDPYCGADDKLTIGELAAAAKEAGIEPTIMAGGYFVEVAVGHENDVAMIDRLDAALSSSVCDEYAMAFLSELARLERQLLLERGGPKTGN